jgi:hypothetical protein
MQGYLTTLYDLEQLFHLTPIALQNVCMQGPRLHLTGLRKLRKSLVRTVRDPVRIRKVTVPTVYMYMCIVLCSPETCAPVFSRYLLGSRSKHVTYRQM